MKKLILAMFVLMLCLSIGAQTQPATTRLSLPEGPIKVTVTGVQGKVQARKSSGDAWVAATEGMELSEGAELRTGPRSAVRFMIGDDQVVSLDRLGTIQILRADFESGKVFTDLGMKYGRARYDIETAAREHDAKVRSPSSVLAVRGTQFAAYDQPPFAPTAVSLNGRVEFRDAHKLVTIGGKGTGKATVDTTTDNSAQFALRDAGRPFPSFEMYTGLQTDVATAKLGSDITGKPTIQPFDQSVPAKSNLDIALLHQNLSIDQYNNYLRILYPGASIVQINIQEQLFFGMDWTGTPGSDVDLRVVSPQGDIIDKAHPMLPTTRLPVAAVYQDSPPADANGVGGTKAVNFTSVFPAGKYTITSTLTNPGAPGKNVNVTVNALKDPTGQANDFAQLGPNGQPFQFQLSEKAPSQTVTVDAQPAPPVPAAGVKTSSKKKHR